MELIHQIIHEAKYNQGLNITSKMKRQAKGNKMHMIVKMTPHDFLKLTTPDSATIDKIQKSCRNLEDYNQWAEQGESIIMPFLYVNGDTGKITGHEGRHRSAALICSGVTEIPVSIRVRPSEEHKKKYGYFEATYDMKFEDLPDYLYGEYGEGVVSKHDLQVVADGQDSLK